MPPEQDPASLAALLQRGAALLSANQPEQASALCERGLPRYPSSAELYQLAGACAMQMQRYDQAEQCWRRAIALRPGQAQLHLNLGILLAQRQRLPEAESSLRRALELDRRLPQAHYNLAVMLSRRGQAADAERHYRQALALDSGFVDALYNLATLLGAQGRGEEAEAGYGRLLALQPRHAEAWSNLAVLLRGRKQHEEAQNCYRRVLELQPGNFNACLGLADTLQEGARAQEAAQCAQRAAQLAPPRAAPLCDLGALWSRLGQGEESERCYCQALALEAGFVRAHLGLAQVLEARGNSADAEQCYHQALHGDPRSLAAHYNLALLLDGAGRTEEAEACYRQALEVDSGFAPAAHNLAKILLQREQFAEGWFHFESRYSPRRPQRAVVLPQADFPQWRGEPLAGKSILVLPEQGFGDQIQMCRYVPLLKRAGAASVTLVCPPELRALFETLPGVDRLVLWSEAESQVLHDYWTLLLSLPHCLGGIQPGIPDQLSYLAVPAQRRDKWQGRLPPAALRVGLAWRGSSLHPNNLQRSLPGLEALAPLWTVPGVRYFSLQKGDGEEQARHPPPEQPLLDLGPQLEDFADTAAVIEQLDLVISVDSALAHLAGSLNRPCWMLLPAKLDWRHPSGGDDWPWYPQCLRLFRRGPAADWASAVEQVRAALLRRRGLPHGAEASAAPAAR